MLDLGPLFDTLWTTDLLWLYGFAVLTGLVRGFSGFGAAMVFIPLASILVPPQTAVITLWLIDVLVTSPLTIKGMRHGHWPEILPLFLGAMAGVPLGVWLLATTPETPMRWTISIIVLLAVLVLASGYRRKNRMPLPGVLAVGASAGVGSGMASLGGPPVIVFWVSGAASAAQTRMNIFGFFGMTALMSGAGHYLFGLFTPERLMLAALLIPAYALGIFSGNRMFGLASESMFRRFALTICAAGAILVMPVWR